MNGFRSVHVLEAIPFASRLHVLGPMVRGFVDAGAAVNVFRPDRSDGSDLSDFRTIAGSGWNEVVVSDVSVASARDVVSRKRIVSLIKAVLADQTRAPRTTVILTAIDDYVRYLPELVIRLRLARGRPDVVFVRYRVDDFSLVAPRNTLKRHVKRLYFRTLTLLARATVVVFDERLADQASVVVVPDPWSGPFGAMQREEARQALKWRSEPVAMLVGYQDARKGFDVSVDVLLRAHAEIPELRVLIVGRIDPRFESCADALRIEYSDALTHIQDYVSDEDLAVRMAAANVVLLPYDASFTSTSGVLARAAASGTPVLATSGGLVAWRVEQHRMGLVFDASNPGQGSLLLERLIHNPEDYSGGPAFAQASSVDQFAASVSRVLSARA